jgi:hypothetical protein
VTRKILVAFVALMAVAMVATPVLAIGPFKALDVGNNKNLEPLWTGVTNHRAEDGKGMILWIMGASGTHWVRWEFQNAASQAKGLTNNAIIAGYSGAQNGLMPYFMSLATGNINKWIYLSGDGEGYPAQYAPTPDPFGIGTHGMLWWFMFGMAWSAKYAEVINSGGTPAAAMAAANAAGIAAGNLAVAEHPQGLFWKINEIKGSLP